MHRGKKRSREALLEDQPMYGPLRIPVLSRDFDADAPEYEREIVRRCLEGETVTPITT